jgi:lysophospholipase L1-like esterase
MFSDSASKLRAAAVCILLFASLFAASGALAQTTLPADPATREIENVDLRFSFGARKIPPFFKQVLPSDAYSIDRGYGFDLGSQVQDNEPQNRTSLSSISGKDGKPFFFSAKLPPGAYRVTVMLGGAIRESVTTVKSETRRLMLEAVHAAPGESQERTFLVHVRVPQIPGGGVVGLKDREKLPILYVLWDDKTQIPFLELDWDEKLTLEFSDAQAAVCSVEIHNAEIDPQTRPYTTVYLVGDSTMTDQMMEPWAAWGQMFPRFFKPIVLIANYAECGETTASFIGERRWPKLMSEIHSGDFVFMQFGINDRSIPLDRFKQYFVQFINDTRQKKAIPVLVTSQNLRRLDANGKAINTLGGYPDAMRQVAKEQNVALIDLNAMSMKLYEAIGPEKLPRAFVDGTHHSDYGAYELAKCVVQGMIDNKHLISPLAVVDDWKTFDPSHPDSLEDFKLPVDPQLDPARPGGPGAPDGRGPMAGAIPRGRGGASRASSQPAGR